MAGFDPSTEAKRGDVVLRGSLETGFVVIDAITREFLTSPVSVVEAWQFAQKRGADQIWQQQLDDRGRPLGQPIRMLHKGDRCWMRLGGATKQMK